MMSQRLLSKAYNAGALQLPEPTLEKPLIQLDFLFDRLIAVELISQKRLKRALSFYRRYLAETHNYDADLSSKKLFYLCKQWDSFALVKVQSFLNTLHLEKGTPRLSSSSVANVIGALRSAMQYAAAHKLTKVVDIFSTPCAPVRRETTVSTAYSEQEEKVINQWLYDKFQEAYKVLHSPGYQRTGSGRDPRIRAPYRRKGTNQISTTGFGWGYTDNLRWYFEHVMQCNAVYEAVPFNHPHYRFYYYASRKQGGCPALFTVWQIKPVITLEVIMPLALKLCSETGLNPESLLNLTADCFQEKHPLTGLPFIQYYKARSQGDMELHLSPYDKNATIREFKEAQARIIRDTVALIRQATDLLRTQAPQGSENLLFLFQTAHKGYFRVKRLHSYIISRWCRAQVVAAGLQAENGQRLQLTMQRFRPTMITKMVRKGEDFFAIRDRCGHLSMETTFKYLERQDLNSKAHYDTAQALQVIHDNQMWQQTVQPEYSCVQSSPSKEVIFKGIMVDCRNVFDPPEEVKKLKEYQPAQACSRHNMCLFCKNVVIMRHHLPMLVLYQYQIHRAMDHNTLELPNAHHYHRTLSVLEGVLDPAQSEFSQEDIAWAHTAAECLDEFVDPVVYQPTL